MNDRNEQKERALKRMKAELYDMNHKRDLLLLRADNIKEAMELTKDRIKRIEGGE